MVASSSQLILFGYNAHDTSDIDDLASIRKHSFMPLPDHITPFWRLSRVDVWGARTMTLIRRCNDELRYYRVLYIVIAFLGPYNAWGLRDGYAWNRGWRYR